jgi:hypothetical protein
MGAEGVSRPQDILLSLWDIKKPWQLWMISERKDTWEDNNTNKILTSVYLISYIEFIGIIV